MNAPWHPGNTTPPAPGIYERDYQKIIFPGIFDEPTPFFCRWDGEKWFAGFCLRHSAERTPHPANPCFNGMPWREIKSPKTGYLKPSKTVATSYCFL